MHVVQKSEKKLWFGGYGAEPYLYVVEKGSEKKFLGGCFIVETYADLEKYYLRSDITLFTNLCRFPCMGPV